MFCQNLSKRAGNSKGMLVEVDKYAVNPSISTLCKLSAAFGILVADLVSVESTPSINVIDKEAIPALWTG